MGPEEDFDYARFAWISGGARGIGLECACKLASIGTRGIALVDKDENAFPEAVARLRRTSSGTCQIHCYTCDVTDGDEIEKTLHKAVSAFHGRLDVVVNCAGIRDESCVQQHFAVNTFSVIRSTFTAIDIMRETCRGRRPGSIINVASAAGVYPLPESKVYSAAKHAVVGFSRCFTDSLKVNNVKVNVICPGFADTAFIADMKKNEDGQRLLKRVGVMEPSTVANAFMQLLDIDSSGEVLYVSANTGVFFPLEQQVKQWHEVVRKYAHARKRKRLSKL